MFESMQSDNMDGQMSVFKSSSGHSNTFEGVYSTVERPQYMNCCVCGMVTETNQSRMCINCIRSEIDIAEGISRQVVLPYCRQCERFQKPPWVSCQLESRELLALCLKKIKGLNTVRLVDAAFIWTEPHSKRLKVKCTIQKEIMNGAIVQQNIIIEFYLQGQQCDDCKRSFTPHTWNAVVQVRQRVQHKRTFLYLEQLILKNGAHEKVSNIVERPDGLDFQFQQKNHAQTLVDFITHHFVAKVKTSRQLISHDSHSNTHHNKFTFSVELSPICKDDVVFVPKSLSTTLLGGVSSILLCKKITNKLCLLDPFTGKEVDLAREKYWQHAGTAGNNNSGGSGGNTNRSSLAPLLSRSSLVNFYVMNVDILRNSYIQDGGKGKRSCVMAEVELCKESDLGKPDSSVIVTTHLGNVINPGDLVSGYDFRTLNNFGSVEDSSEFIQWKERNHDVIVVKKVVKRGYQYYCNSVKGDEDFDRYSSLQTTVVQRPWVLQRLPKQTSYDSHSGNLTRNEDIEQFKDELEEDVEMRKGVNLYWDPRIQDSAREVYRKMRKPRHMVKKEKSNKNTSGEMIIDCCDGNSTKMKGEYGSDDDYDYNNTQEDENQLDISELLDGLSIDDLQ
ncbi:NMD3p like involved in nonsense mediated decay [Cryptosporidium bovis]|uniref:NMD3p like involved in nonsense mediated decay n=1 Tax=Cryptosporidium bovis TaxID=310047 RepID=UPI00351A0C8B|nr:NMD3p like involved in nonsense mediated decay [Cryptosporidium bovis]